MASETILPSGDLVAGAPVAAAPAGEPFEDGLVSIITPAWNSAKTLPATIASVEAQTWPNWEMIIVDDCSSDGTFEVASAAAAADPRIVALRAERNGGPAHARNIALARARGRWVAFLDADDLWLPEKLAHQLAFMASRKAAFSHTAYRRFRGDPAQAGDVIHPPGQADYGRLLRGNRVGMLTAMLDRARLGDIRLTEAPTYDDYALWLEIARRGFAALGFDQDLARYRVNDASVSSRPMRSIRWTWHLYRRIERLSFFRAGWYLAHYGWQAIRKRRTLQ